MLTKAFLVASALANASAEAVCSDETCVNGAVVDDEVSLMQLRGVVEHRKEAAEYQVDAEERDDEAQAELAHIYEDEDYDEGDLRSRAGKGNRRRRDRRRRHHRHRSLLQENEDHPEKKKKEEEEPEHHHGDDEHHHGHHHGEHKGNDTARSELVSEDHSEEKEKKEEKEPEHHHGHDKHHRGHHHKEHKGNGTAHSEFVAEAAKGPDDDLEPWMERYCIQTRTKMANCAGKIAEEEANCGVERRALKSVGGRGFGRNNAWFQNQDKSARQCNEYKAAKDSIHAYIEKSAGISNRIGRAQGTCHSQVMAVCVRYTCPLYCAAKRIDVADCKCTQKCKTTWEEMFKTGNLDCSKKKFEPLSRGMTMEHQQQVDERNHVKWEQCLGKLRSNLAKAGRFYELEIITREHYLKCMCVSVTPGFDTKCYQGTHGIPRGEKWCNYQNSPSWEELLKNLPEGVFRGYNARNDVCSMWPLDSDGSPTGIAWEAQERGDELDPEGGAVRHAGQVVPN